MNNFLKKKELGTGEVTIRVLSSYDKVTEVKPLMLSRYELIDTIYGISKLILIVILVLELEILFVISFTLPARN